MILIYFFIFIGYSLAMNNSIIDQFYSRIRLFEYLDYSDVTFFKFNIIGPTKFVNWSMIIHTNGKCSNYPANTHFALQHGTYPLFAPQNESFPDMYIINRHDLFIKIFNRTITNTTIELINPLQGTWFGMAFIERWIGDEPSKISSSTCNISLTTWLDYQVEPISFILTLNQAEQVVLSNNLTFVYASYLSSITNSRINMQSEWLTDCNIEILGRINGLPDSDQYDYRIVCKNESCLLQIDRLSSFLWIYFRISVQNLSCLNNLVRGSIMLQSIDCLSSSDNIDCILSIPMRRIITNSYYEYTYVLENSNSSVNNVTFNKSSIYSYEFLVDERNIGGTIHLDLKTVVQPIRSLPMNNVILGCLSKNRARRYETCENDYKISIDANFSTIRSLPYPEMALWYLTLESNTTTSVSLTFQIFSSKCTREQCGTYGTCQILTSQQNIFSTCICVAGYRGYGCTDSRYNRVWKYLPSVLFLTLSNLLFIPTVGLALYYHLYIEALVYFFNMFFSTFYHACDQEIRRFCIFKYDGLQLSDFIGSYFSFVITLITMSIISRSIKVFLFILGLLTCIVLNAHDRFNTLQILIVIIITFSFMILTWIIVSVKNRRLQPTKRRLLCILPGILLAIAGIVLFIFVETDDNYWYTHSLWHMFMASSILFFLPQKIREQEDRRRTSHELNAYDSSVGVINQGVVVTENGNVNSTT